MNNKQKYFAIPLAVVMSPIILAGLITGFFWEYFNSGMDMWEVISEAIDKWVDK